MAETWDETVPAGSEAISNGDNRIRSLKTCIKEFLLCQGSSGTEAIFPGSSSAAPIYRVRFLRGTTGSRPAASADQGIYVNTTTNTIQRCNDASWVDIATLIPSGTVMCFFQTAAPTGWTQVTTHNDKIMRVVSGSGGGSGGSTALTSCWTATTTGSEASHTHTISGSTDSGSVGGAASGPSYTGPGNFHVHAFSITSGAGSSHAHTVTSYAPQYIDVLLASKD